MLAGGGLGRQFMNDAISATESTMASPRSHAGVDGAADFPVAFRAGLPSRVKRASSA